MCLSILRETKKELEDSLPFAMEPVVYNWGINHKGTWAALHEGDAALMPTALLRHPRVGTGAPGPGHGVVPAQGGVRPLYHPLRHRQPGLPAPAHLVSNLFKVSEPAGRADRRAHDEEADRIKRENGFDYIQHEAMREDLQKGRIGLFRNRLPAETRIEDVREGDFAELATRPVGGGGEKALRGGKVAVLSLAAGVGSRWTKGAGVIKALNPFLMIDGTHRSFLEIHLAKTRRTAERFGAPVPHLVATSYLTHEPIRRKLAASGNYGYAGPVYLSPGRSIGQRLVPMERDLRFLWEETPQETLDENKQKVRESVRQTLIGWARSKGEGADYSDNLAGQRFSPLGHWYEVSNLLRNGTLARLLDEHPAVETLMLHNIDTLGADVDPAALDYHLASGNVLTFEVVPRRIDDRGGGLARVNGHVRLLEGLAQPREEDELKLSYYNSMTTWIQIDPLLALFGLTRADLKGDDDRLAEAVRKVAARMPTYVTIKDVKFRWGHGQEDIYPVAQVEKLWSDMSGLQDIKCGYLAVPRLRGQQMKDPAQLDSWVNDGSRDYVAGLGRFG